MLCNLLVIIATIVSFWFLYELNTLLFYDTTLMWILWACQILANYNLIPYLPSDR